MKKEVLINETYFIISFLIIILPIFFFGLNDIEEYNGSIATIKILQENNFNPLTFYYDLIGPGTKLPMGYGLINFPTIFLISNFKIYYFVTILLCYRIQFISIKKLLNFLKLNNFFLINILYLFSISTFNYTYTDDWGLHPYLFYSSLPLITYYSIKFLIQKKKITFYKLLFFLIFLHLNMHPALIVLAYLYIVFIFLMNKKFFFLKYKYFYWSIIIFTLSISENLYSLFVELNNYSGIDRSVQEGYKFKHIFSGIYLFLTYFETFNIIDFPGINEYNKLDSRLPFTNIIFYFSLYFAIRQIINNKSKEIYYLNYLFLIFLTFSFSSSLKSLKIFSGIWLFRDLYGFLSIILFGYWINDLTKAKIKNTIIFVSIIFLINFYLQNAFFKYNNGKNIHNILNQNINFKKSESYDLFSNIDNKEKFKIYLSPISYKKLNIDRIFNDANIFSNSDLIKYNLYPFTYKFQGSAKNSLRKPTRFMHSEVGPDLEYSEINDNYFFDLFKIKYLLITKDELKFINTNLFLVLKQINIKNNKFFLLQKVKINSLEINNKEDIEIINKISCNKFETVRCITNSTNLITKNNNIEITRIGFNLHKVSNKNDEKKFSIIPFLYDPNWKLSNQDKIINIKNTLGVIKLEPFEEIILYYNDSKKNYLKIMSFITIFLLMIYNCFSFSSFKIFLTKDKKL